MNTNNNRWRSLFAGLLLIPTFALAEYACPPPSDTRGGWQPESCFTSCKQCGTVQSVSAIEGKASGVGAAVGAVAGGLLGNQVGKGKGRTLATIAGAVGGGVAGHYGEKKYFGNAHWEVLVQMNDGSTRTFALDHDPGFANGDRVWASGEALTRY